MQPVLLILKRLIFDSGIDIGVDSTTSERRYLVQSLDLHDRIRNYSERVAERALKGHLNVPEFLLIQKVLRHSGCASTPSSWLGFCQMRLKLREALNDQVCSRAA